MNRPATPGPRDRRRRHRPGPGRARRAGGAARPGAAGAQPVPRGQPAASPTRVFGGQVAGQALVAAGRTVPADRDGALAARLLHPPRRPAASRSSTRPSGCATGVRSPPAGCWRSSAARRSSRCPRRSSCTRRGWSTPSPPRPTCRTRSRCPTSASGWPAAAAPAGWPAFRGPIDIRFVEEPVWAADRGAVGRADAGLDARRRTAAGRPAAARLPADLRQRHDAARLGDRPARPDPANVQMASLDHAMWFHRPFRADEWLLYTCYSPSASGSRGLATGRFTTRDGHWWRRRCRKAWSGSCGGECAGVWVDRAATVGRCGGSA